MTERGKRSGRRGRRFTTETASAHSRSAAYRRLVNPLIRQPVFSDDRVDAIHETALKVLEELGIKVLNKQARDRFKKAGAEVDDDSWMIRLDRGLVAEAIRTAPGQFDLIGGAPERTVTLGGDHVAFMGVGGPPHISDLDHGKRPGTMEDTRNLIKLTQHFDVVHLLSPNVEPQDVPINIRHLDMTHAEMTLSDKAPFIYSRGPGQVRDCFEMIRLARGLDEAAFAAQPYCYTVINTNSPRQLDIPMCQGIMDFADVGQISLITPFTLSGAMAPVTIAGALTLAHAEALAGITLAQISRPGAPVLYGSFTSNVDMKSGSPAFGTPESLRGRSAPDSLHGISTCLGAGRSAPPRTLPTNRRCTRP